MNAVHVIAHLRARNIELSVLNGQLRAQGSKQALHDPELLALVRAYKPALIEALAQGVDQGPRAVPPNLIPPACTRITPQLLTLVTLDQTAIDAIVAAVPGGAPNVQDIYPLGALQQGILFHHQIQGKGDVYLLPSLLRFDSRARLDRYVAALQAAIARHDILRTSFHWEDLPEPVQVVWRHAPLTVEQVEFDPVDGAGDIAAQLQARFHPQHYRLDVRQAPLWRLFVAQDGVGDCWVALDLMQHLITDHTSGALLHQEIEAHLLGEGDDLPAPLPFRNFIAQARLGVSCAEHEAFFTRMLGGVDAPTLPFGLADAQGDGSMLVEAHQGVDPALAKRLRACARALGVSVACICHLAWAMVLARVSGREIDNDAVVFGTLLFGRMRAGTGAEQVLGMFINTLPVRIEVGDASARSALRTTHELLSELIRHEHAPLALAQRCSGVRAPAPLFTAHLNYRYEGRQANDAATSAAAVAVRAARAWAGIEVLREEERTNYPLGLAVNDLEEGFSLDVQVDASIDPQRVFALVQTAFAALVTALEQNAATPLRELDVLPRSERDALLALGHGAPGLGFVCEGLPGGLFGLVAVQAQRSPEATALVDAHEVLSYRELVRRANGVARQLRALAIGAESRVAILVDRSAEAIVGVLGILAAGAAYVPLDPSHPDERLAFMLGDAAVAVLLVPAALRERAQRLGGPQLLVIGSAAGGDGLLALPDVRPDQAAYVIYTSGSTGMPKGVVVEQRSVLNLVEGFAARHDFAGQRLLMIPPLVFDASVGDIFPVLAVGATLVLHPAPTELDALALQAFCAAQRVSAIDAPAALWRRWTEDLAGAGTHEPAPPVLPGIKLLMFGGERVTLEQVRRFAALTGGRVAISNHYGPTEATVCATLLTTRDASELSGTELPIGTPLPGVQVYVLDRLGRMLPRGAEGELFIGGAGVARGYLGEAPAHSGCFVADPFSAGQNEPMQARMYATGDLVRWNGDGNLQFVGRRDQQVKIRGFRIELGEIEARLIEHAGVREAAVLAREDEAGDVGDKRLVAYVVAAVADAAAQLDAESLRTHLAAVLPEPMVPAAYVQLDRLPLTRNGKLDRKALPAPDASAFIYPSASRAYAAPVGEIETTLARIWAEVLKLEPARIGRHANFFELGGHSLLAASQMARLRRALGVEVALKELFAHPVLCDFAKVLSEANEALHSAPSPIDRVPRDAALVLSFAQQRLWFLAQMDGVSEAYHMPLALRLSGELDALALKCALDRIVYRHEALRTTFRRNGEQPVQHIAAPDVGFELNQHDLRDRIDPQAEFERRSAAEANQPFDLARGPLIRGQLLRLGQFDHGLLITMHHIVSDAWSLGVLAGELNTLYRAFSAGLDDPLPPLVIQYADHAVWQRRWLTGAVLQQQRDYWRHALEGAPGVLTLPADRPRPAQQSFAGAQLVLELDPALTRRLKSLAQRHGITLYMTLLSAWATVLARLSGQDEVVIGSPVANRTRAETEGLIGLFINTLALRVRVAGKVSELLARVRATALDAQQHQELPFEQVVDLVKPPRSLAHTPVFQVMFTWQNADEGELHLPGLALTHVDAPYPVAKFDLELELREVGGEDGERIAGRLGYATALFDRATIERHAGCLRQVLLALVEEDQRDVAQIDLLTPTQRQQLLVQWNATPAEPAPPICLHALFEAQVRQRPDAIALLHEGRSMTYAVLNRRANQLARHLRQLGVVPDAPVAIAVERGFEMMIGLLAILKAGGAYVPLDRANPAERLAFMLKDCAPVVLLVDAPFDAAVDARATPVLDLHADAAAWAGELDIDFETQVTPQHLAYVIYTSGSTGAPKGVMVEHANVARLLAATEDWFHFGPHDVWTMFHSYAFDFSVWEMWGALAYGGRLVIVPHATARSPQAFHELLRREQVTVLNQTPSAFRQLIAAQAEADAVGEGAEQHNLRTVIFGGEALETSMLKPWYERKGNHATLLVNMYGITETCVHVTYRPLFPADAARPGPSPIGVRIPDLRIYILDAQRQPVPIGVEGELFVGGPGVARGYLNRPELTAQRFLADPFCTEPGARLYKTGDLGRWRVDGSIEYLGRNDQQVKIRGFRVELGEIEARLAEHASVADAVVLARSDEVGAAGVAGDQRLVAYVTLKHDARDGATLDVDVLRKHLASTLPEHMVPAAYVTLARLPLTPNGKLDRKALPAPGATAYLSRAYEAPVGKVETTLARIWADVLKHEPGRIGRHANFFELGGHSLLAITLVERMRRAGMQTDVRAVFASTTLSALAEALGSDELPAVDIPPNLIPAGCTALTPAMLPLVALTERELAAVVASVPGGAANVQDIYPLTPLQAGMLFLHQMQGGGGGGGDVYLTTKLLSFASRAHLARYVQALQAVIDRHDILRTAFVAEGLTEPVQVVWRSAALVVEEVDVAQTGDIAAQLRQRCDPQHHCLDVRQAPLWRLFVAEDVRSHRWLAVELVHHLIDDNTSVRFLMDEMEAHLNLFAHRSGEVAPLPAPLPFRNFVAQARLGVSDAEHERFFRAMLADVAEPTLPFGLTDVQGDGGNLVEAQRKLDPALARRLRAVARACGASAASVCHLAWALLLARVSGRDDVVFGTVLFGRLQGTEGSDRALGMFINMLPLRIQIGAESVQTSVLKTQERLSGLMRHEHAPLALAQRCSAIRAPAPLFAALLNYRHSAAEVPSAEAVQRSAQAWAGIDLLDGQERTNYPFSLFIDDEGDGVGGFSLTAQVDASVDPQQVCALMQTALESLVTALEQAPATPVCQLDVLPAAQRTQVLVDFNATAAAYPRSACLHQLVEAQAARTPQAVAVEHKGRTLSYAALNARANQLAHHLRARGVVPDARVAICLPRCIEMVVALLAVLKAGGAYVPLDPAYPVERLNRMLADCAPVAVLVNRRGEGGGVGLDTGSVPVFDLRADASDWAGALETKLPPGALRSDHLAYVLYTSGSTGVPKGVAIEHRNAVNFVCWAQQAFAADDSDDLRDTLFATSINFDLSVFECFVPLSVGGTLHLVDNALALIDQPAEVTLINTVPSAMAALLKAGAVPASTRVVNLAGEALKRELVERLFADTQVRSVCNLYGPTETTTYSTWAVMRSDTGFVAHIGRPLANTQVYVLDARRQPVPVGVVGEIYIGGDGVARGYLNQPELTAQRFSVDPFSHAAKARMYRTGDLGRWLADGTIEYLGRNDHQVKLRGFRIELGEIEAKLAEHPSVGEAVVLAREDRLVAYVTPRDAHNELDLDALRRHLADALPAYMLPSACVALERLPLTPNGKLDREALPAPYLAATVAVSGEAHEAPASDLEKKLARVWAEVLQVDRVGRFDNFFDLGGHSLLAARTVSLLRQTGLDIGVVELFRCPTVQTLAVALSSSLRKGAAHPSPTGALKVREGTGTPLFLVHDGYGDDTWFAALAQHMATPGPVFGLPKVPSHEPPLTTVPAMARRMVGLMREVQAQGPYRVAGWSFGGVLAYEIARQLIEQGAGVEFLGLIDAFCPASPDPDDDDVEGAPLIAPPDSFVLLTPDEAQERRRCLAVHGQAMQRYRAARLGVGIPVHLFVAGEGEGEGELALGWERCVPPNLLRRCSVPGSHVSMMKPPHIPVLGQRLTAALADGRSTADAAQAAQAAHCGATEPEPTP